MSLSSAICSVAGEELRTQMILPRADLDVDVAQHSRHLVFMDRSLLHCFDFEGHTVNC
jgi:hypothetical protein